MATYQWTGAGDGTSWTDPGNWQSGPAGTYPGGTTTNDTVFLPAGSYTFDIPPWLHPLNTIQASGNANVALTFNGPGVMSANTLGGANGHPIDLTINGGTMTGNAFGAGAGTNPATGGFDLTLENGGTFVAANNNGIHSINFGLATGSQINLFVWPGNNNTGSNNTNAWASIPITGIDSSSRLIAGQAGGPSDQLSVSVTSNGNGTYTVHVTDTTNPNFTTAYANVSFAPGFDPNSLGAVVNTYITTAGQTFYEIQLVCFLEGTQLLAGGAEVAVEMLQPGDMITALVNGEKVLRPVKWVGRRQVKAIALSPDEAYPVRIRAGAFADAVPRRDMLITGEHCILVNGKLVPVRMLVNGRSIFIDRAIDNYIYYHVELEKHSVLLAEGLPAESYLDTGNRANFANSGMPRSHPHLSVAAGHRCWAEDAAAELSVARAFVEPIWQALEQRALACGHAASAPPRMFTPHADLRLRTDSGTEIRASHTEAGRHSFLVPAGSRTLRILSRAARPSEVIGPFVDDRRSFGVNIGEIIIREGDHSSPVTAHLTVPVLDGWHQPEQHGRWTNGDAMLPVNLGNEPVSIEFEVLAAGPYLVAQESLNQAPASVA